MGSVGAFYQSRLSENIRNSRAAQQARQPVWTARKNASPETPVEPVKAVRPISRDEASLPELTARLENDPAAMAGRMRTRYGEIDPEGMFVETGKEGLSPVDGSRKNALEGQLAQAEDALGRNDLEGAEDVLSRGAPDAEEGRIPGLPGQEKEDASVLPGQDKAEDEKALDGKSAQGAESAQEALEEGECETCESRKYQDGSDDMGVSFQTPTNIKPEQAASPPSSRTWPGRTRKNRRRAPPSRRWRDTRRTGLRRGGPVFIGESLGLSGTFPLENPSI